MHLIYSFQLTCAINARHISAQRQCTIFSYWIVRHSLLLAAPLSAPPSLCLLTLFTRHNWRAQIREDAHCEVQLRHLSKKSPSGELEGGVIHYSWIFHSPLLPLVLLSHSPPLHCVKELFILSCIHSPCTLCTFALKVQVIVLPVLSVHLLILSHSKGWGRLLISTADRWWNKRQWSIKMCH